MPALSAPRSGTSPPCGPPSLRGSVSKRTRRGMTADPKHRNFQFSFEFTPKTVIRAKAIRSARYVALGGFRPHRLHEAPVIHGLIVMDSAASLAKMKALLPGVEFEATTCPLAAMDYVKKGEQSEAEFEARQSSGAAYGLNWKNNGGYEYGQPPGSRNVDQHLKKWHDDLERQVRKLLAQVMYNGSFDGPEVGPEQRRLCARLAKGIADDALPLPESERPVVLNAYKIEWIKENLMYVTPKGATRLRDDLRERYFSDSLSAEALMERLTSDSLTRARYRVSSGNQRPIMIHSSNPIPKYLLVPQ